MDYKQALEYIDGMQWFGSKPGLERIGELLEKLGNPQDKLRYVHVTGTNGKGSCCAMLASCLKACGCKTGLYTSPYLYDFNERMQINGHRIENETLAQLVSRVAPIADAMDEHPTEFELMTAVAFEWFAQENCDIVVLEVGMGGEFDATNIIKCPEAAVIMNIGLDHTAVLGKTVEEIAATKAGIIKPGCECVCYGHSDNIDNIIAQRCEELGARLTSVDFSSIAVEFDSVAGQVFTYKNNPYAISLLGAHQRRNAAVVIETLEALRRRGFRLDEGDAEHGLYAASWPGRFELISDEPLFVVDGGHNPQCAQTIAENTAFYFPGIKRVALIGILADKDFCEFADIINPVFDEYVCITPNSPRALSAEKLAEHLKRFGKSVSAYDSIDDGIEAAKAAAGSSGVVVAMGSLYSAGQIRACFNLY